MHRPVYCVVFVSILGASDAIAQAPAATPPAAPVTETGTAGAPPEPPPSTMNRRLSVFGALGYGYGYGAGYGLAARYQFVIVPNGLLKMAPGKRDELGIEAGVDFLHVGWDQNLGPGVNYSWSYNEFTPVVGVAWNFWLSDKVALYPKVDLGYHFGSVSATSTAGTSVSTSGVAFSALYFHGAGGIVYDLGSVAFRAEAGWATLRVGIAFRPF